MAESPDGKHLATANGAAVYYEIGIGGGNSLGADTYDKDISLWNSSTCQLLFQVPDIRATALVFSPDSGLLAIGTEAGDLLVLPVDSMGPKFLHPVGPEQLWARLAEVPYSDCYKAMWTLAAGGNTTVDFLAKKMHVFEKLDNNAIRKWIAGLDDSRFTVRQDSSNALAALGLKAVPGLRAAVAANPSLETRRRIEHLLKRFEPEAERPATEIRRQLRAVEILAEIDTPEAHRLLKEIANRSLIVSPAARKALQEMPK